MSKIIQVHNVSKKYRDNKTKSFAVDNVSFEIEEGENMAIIGPSGSGKTTLLHLLGGLDNPSSGEIRIDNKVINNMKDKDLSSFRNKTIGFVFQFFYLQEYITALENVALPMLLENKLPKKEIFDRAKSILNDFGLAHRINHYPNQISGGEMQRIAVARSMINNPKIILADEPTGNLDKENTEKILNIFDKISQQGVSIIVITHDDWIAKKFNRILKLRNGKIVN